MTVYDTLEKRHVMPRAWEDWAAYRRAWSQWILHHCERGGSLLIVGAGACNDYELEHLLQFFDRITLYDVDEQAMQAALRRVPAADRSRVDCETGDLLGIDPEEYREFCAVIQSEVNRCGKLTDITQLAQTAYTVAQSMYARAAQRREQLVLPQSDAVAVSGVHSQINHMLPWIWEAYMQVLGQREERIFCLASEENSRIAAQINRKLCEAARSALFVSAEASRAGVPGGVEGAWQALADLKKRADESALHVGDTTHFAWGYDLRQNMIYDMEAMALLRPCEAFWRLALNSY